MFYCLAAFAEYWTLVSICTGEPCLSFLARPVHIRKGAALLTPGYMMLLMMKKALLPVLLRQGQTWLRLKLGQKNPMIDADANREIPSDILPYHVCCPGTFGQAVQDIHI
ncbi:hypothetical protein DPMN_174554 [Dreissena polymorpha]|uniref:Uncharacterized protein n=1 Tax=Dreissena polymorpha TaxID=45954 RepID=A0A9D4IHY9_DREPO|nr:hypothetical protein DPMN_174554 [Dreissena polymorpha]